MNPSVKAPVCPDCPKCAPALLGVGDGALLLDYERMFLAPNVTFVPLSALVYERA
jgi:hypothetical protein